MDTKSCFVAPPGWVVRYFPEVGSTNDLAKEAGESGASDRTLFLADHQTRGRGRLARTWVAPPGSSLLFSLLFRSHIQPFLLTVICSVAACEAVEMVAGLRAEIKWPNDLMVEGRKLAGVLTEVSWSPGSRFAVVGMGLNVNFDPSTVPGLPASATSLLRETGKETSRQELLHRILLCLDSLLALDPAELEREAWSRWAARLWRRRQRVVVAEGGRAIDGVFEGVAEDGALLLRLDDGTVEAVRVGDLVI